MNTSSKLLTVYTASAGSGKTYTLTRDFIAFALSQNEKNYFRHVLAITFTRKATKEMKDRIVKELYKLATGKSTASYIAELKQITHLGGTELQSRAKQTLSALLTDYTSFRVKTIDSFFEDIVRSFASEIGYSNRYKIELDAETRLHRATLQLLSNIQSQGEFEESYTRVKELVEDAVAEGKRYSITKTVESLGRKLFYETSIDSTEDGSLPSNKAISSIRKTLEEYLTKVEGKCQQRGSSQEKIFSTSAKYILDQLSVIGTLADIKETLREMGKSSNSMLLHSSQAFIREIIQDSDTPFIYERVGTQVNHYLIDEFQDTSRLQFQNLRPLLENSLARGYRNLVVGDIKQSIYKFRHCDRTLLSKSIFNKFKDHAQKKNLGYNWRSAKEIVDFNNTLFNTIPTLVKQSLEEVIKDSLKKHDKHNTLDPVARERLVRMPSDISENYKEVAQEVPIGSTKHGGIEVKSVEDENSIATSLPETILELVEKKGYSPSDIAILCYRNSEVASIASILLQYSKEHPEKAQQLRFTGSEALHITNSQLIGFIIELFRALNAPENMSSLEMARFRYEYLRRQCPSIKTPQEGFEKLFSTLQSQIDHVNLYDLTELSIKLSLPMIKEEESPYLMMFLDLVSTFSKEEVADLYSFLYWWDEKGCKTDLPAENVSNAIRLLTLHKSKGLEFPIVLLPFPTWDLGVGKAGISELLRVRIPESFKGQTGCSNLDATYVKQVSKLADTIFIEDYYNEVTANIIDRLNLFYVATTRAELGLILWLQKDQSNIKKPTKTSFPLEYFVSPAIGAPDNLPPIPECSVKSETSADEKLILPSLEKLFGTQKNTLLIRHSGESHFKDNERIKYGSTMHELMSKLTSPKDCERLLKEAEKEGKITPSKIQEAKAMLEKALNDPIVSSWFSQDVTVFSEQTIISPKEIHFSRPDRVVILPNATAVVIDYKFGKEEPGYTHQVERYCKLVEKVGYSNVEGFLLYLCEDNYKVEKVYTSNSTNTFSEY